MLGPLAAVPVALEESEDDADEDVVLLEAVDGAEVDEEADDEAEEEEVELPLLLFEVVVELEFVLVVVVVPLKAKKPAAAIIMITMTTTITTRPTLIPDLVLGKYMKFIAYSPINIICQKFHYSGTDFILHHPKSVNGEFPSRSREG